MSSGQARHVMAKCSQAQLLPATTCIHSQQIILCQANTMIRQRLT